MSVELIKEAAAAKILGLSVATIRTYRSTRRVIIPFVKIGKSCRYDPKVLEKYIQEHTVGGEG